MIKLILCRIVNRQSIHELRKPISFLLEIELLQVHGTNSLITKVPLKSAETKKMSCEFLQ